MATQLENNTTELQAILDAVNALPEAGGSGGGGSVETCTLSVNSAFTITACTYLALVNGSLRVNESKELVATSLTLENAVVGSLVTITLNAISEIYAETNNVIYSREGSAYSSNGYYYTPYYVVCDRFATASVQLTMPAGGGISPY